MENMSKHNSPYQCLEGKIDILSTVFPFNREGFDFHFKALKGKIDALREQFNFSIPAKIQAKVDEIDKLDSRAMSFP